MKNKIVKTLVIGAALSAFPVISGCTPAEEGPVEEETGPQPAESDKGGDGGEGGGEEATE
tara:strand:+ start:1036 stop:1215 length:180 start_codon:yes stop_codon:yes gene_type:complete